MGNKIDYEQKQYRYSPQKRKLDQYGEWKVMLSVGIQPKIEHVFFNTIAQNFQPILYLFVFSRKESKHQYMV